MKDRREEVFPREGDAARPEGPRDRGRPGQPATRVQGGPPLLEARRKGRRADRTAGVGHESDRGIRPDPGDRSRASDVPPSVHGGRYPGPPGTAGPGRTDEIGEGPARRDGRIDGKGKGDGVESPADRPGAPPFGAERTFRRGPVDRLRRVAEAGRHPGRGRDAPPAPPLAGSQRAGGEDQRSGGPYRGTRMKITIRLVVSLVLVVTLVAGAFAYYQVRDERARLRSGLERRSAILAGILQEAVIPLVASDSSEGLDLP